MVKIPLEDNKIQTTSSGPSRDYEPAPHNSVFEAEVLTVDLVDSRWTDNDGNPKKEMNFKFKVLDDGNFHSRWFWYRCPNWFSDDPRSKLRQTVQEILDEDVLPAGFVLDTENLIGQRCRIIVHAKEKADGSGRIVNWVQEVRPSKAGAQLAPGKTWSDLNDEDIEPF